MKHIITILFVALALMAVAQNTLRKGLQPETAAGQKSGGSAATDTVTEITDNLIDINGYDKPLRSRRETFFVTNNGDRPLAGIAFTLTYLDSKSRQLHKASHNVATDIPAGETRQIGIRSWDTQQAFYYTRSEVPVRASQATPFDVTITVDSLFYAQ